MSVPAPAEVERQLVNTGESSDKRVINIPTSPAQVHERAVQKISDNLTQAGHAQPPEQVSAQGGAEAVLSRIGQSGIGAKVIGGVDEGIHLVRRMGENIVRDVEGSDNIYTTGGEGKGHITTIGRAGRIANNTGVVVRIKNLLFRDKKAA